MRLLSHRLVLFAPEDRRAGAPRFRLLVLSVLLLAWGCSGVERRHGPGAVTSASAIASRVGADVLARGGNAVDAAVATAFALAVAHPAAGNIGGGGFLVARFPDGRATSIDFRETAPAAAGPDMFLRPDGTYDRARHHWSGLAVGVPGSVAGLHLAHERYGRLPWGDLVDPAVALAREGFRISPALAESLADVLPSMERYPASLAQFSRDGEPFEAGDLLVQRELARTLERIRDEGPLGFYHGETARLLVEEVERQGGLISREDLAGYRAIERAPLRGTYRGHEIVSMPPPSSGGVALLTMLGILEPFPIGSLPKEDRIHLLVETMRRAYADRARYLADPEQIAVPVAWLTSAEHAASLRRSIDPKKASRSSPRNFEWYPESEATTHLSVLDRDGLAVALTTTLEQGYGSRMVVPGAGFLLNNEMGDFNPRTGLTTENGLIGTAPNLAAPRKRMLSSMTPTIVAGPDESLLVLGSPGGRTIINTVLQVIVGVIDLQLSLEEAVAAPRFHHQWLPDEIFAEEGAFSPELEAALSARGHRIARRRREQGAVMAIRSIPARDEARIELGVDPRRRGAGAALASRRATPPPAVTVSVGG